MAIYTGQRFCRRHGLACVEKDREPLLLQRSLRLVDHSPTGFNWGYGGSGPAQLALALLLEETTEEEALRYYQSLKWDVVAKASSEWHCTSEQIQQWLEHKRDEDNSRGQVVASTAIRGAT